MKVVVRLLVLGFLMLVASVIVAQDDDLRVINFHIEEAVSVEVELSLEADDVSVLFNVKTSEEDAYIYLVEIYNSDEELIYSLDGDEGIITFGFEPILEDAGGQLGVFLPASPDFELEADDYYFVFEAEESTISEVTAIVRSGDVDSTQAIDFNFWVLTEELSDEDTQADFADVIRESMDAVLNPYDLEVGAIEFFVADDSDYDEYAFPQIDDEDARSLEDVCIAMSDAVGASRAMNVAIIEGFDEQTEEGGTLGVAVIAGNAGMVLDESPFSCVVVSYEAYGEDFENQAYNILHESGHFMSLPHTTESDGAGFDIFDDTPECAAADFDGDDDGFVDDIECDIEGGANNLMFWSGEPEYAPYILSDAQAWVLRRHPLFYVVGN
jgi:hypothetical protein